MRYRDFNKEQLEVKLAEQNEYLAQEVSSIKKRFDMYGEGMTERDRFYLGERKLFIRMLERYLRKLTPRPLAQAA